MQYMYLQSYSPASPDRTLHTVPTQLYTSNIAMWAHRYTYSSTQQRVSANCFSITSGIAHKSCASVCVNYQAATGPACEFLDNTGAVIEDM